MQSLITTAIASSNGVEALRTACFTATPGEPVRPLQPMAFAIVGDRLTNQERRVLALVAAGDSNKTIARRLFVSGATVRSHLQHIRKKLGVTRNEEILLAAAGCHELLFDTGGSRPVPGMGGEPCRA